MPADAATIGICDKITSCFTLLHSLWTSSNSASIFPYALIDSVHAIERERERREGTSLFHLWLSATPCTAGMADARSFCLCPMDQGQSSFMIDLGQISYALRNATPRSLIIADEWVSLLIAHISAAHTLTCV